MFEVLLILISPGLLADLRHHHQLVSRSRVNDEVRLSHNFLEEEIAKKLANTEHLDKFMYLSRNNG